MDPQTVARTLAIGRIGLGAALVAAPKLVLGPWIGKDAASAGPQVVGAALGIRDVVLGTGTLGALYRGDGAEQWMRASVAADLVDLAATLRARDGLPTFGVVSVALMAASGAALGAWAQTKL
jgi:hypothetical protein